MVIPEKRGRLLGNFQQPQGSENITVGFKQGPYQQIKPHYPIRMKFIIENTGILYPIDFQGFSLDFQGFFQVPFTEGNVSSGDFDMLRQLIRVKTASVLCNLPKDLMKYLPGRGQLLTIIQIITRSPAEMIDTDSILKIIPIRSIPLLGILRLLTEKSPYQAPYLLLAIRGPLGITIVHTEDKPGGYINTIWSIITPQIKG
jgi:hypothetical protein